MKKYFYSKIEYLPIWVKGLLLISILLVSPLLYELRENTIHLVVLSILLLFMILLLFGHLKLEIHDSYISVSLFPFHLRPVIYKKDQILSLKVITYNPIYRFGGWGIRTNFKNEKIISISGNKAIKITFTNHKIRLIGISKNNFNEIQKKLTDFDYPIESFKQ